MSFIRRHRSVQAAILFGPVAIWATVFILAPTLMAVAMSFWRFDIYHLVHDWNLDAYREMFSSSIYYDPLLFSIEQGAIVAVVSILLCLPVAHFIHFRAGRHKTLLFGSVVIALWLGYLLRILGWRIILGQDGVINGLLTSVGIVDEPVSWLLYSRFSVVLAQTHIAMPFAFMPVYAAMERLPNPLMEAASDLGASPRRQFFHVELPMIVGGVTTGMTFAFVIAFGDYFAPVLVGPPSAIAIGNIATQQFGAALNWPLGAALGVTMILVVLTVMALPSVGESIARAVRRRRDRSVVSELSA